MAIMNTTSGIVFLKSVSGTLAVTGTAGVSITGPGSGVTLTNGSGTILTLTGTLNTTADVNSGLNFGAASAGAFYWTGKALIKSPADGNVSITNQGSTTGSYIKADALPTIGSGFGAGAAVTAGSTPFAGSVNVGTTAGTVGVITWGGTAFPTAAPFAQANNNSTLQVVKALATTTQVTLTSAGFANNDIVSWLCVGAK
jgi:hypothetical protein